MDESDGIDSSFWGSKRCQALFLPDASGSQRPSAVHAMTALSRISIVPVTIGIGAGPSVSGQVLVYQDVFGNPGFKPKSLLTYANTFGVIRAALKEGGI
jgi:Ketopantoate hydroxymethyltransferase